LFVEIGYADGASDTYQVPLAFSTGADAEDVIANHTQSILSTFSTPTGPAVLHDGVIREDVRQDLLALIETNTTLALSATHSAAGGFDPWPGAAATGQPASETAFGEPATGAGRLDARASSAMAGSHFSGNLPSRAGSAEQSNTSILYGKELILKLFRRLEPGKNPDVEIGRFLTETAHFTHIAPFRGEISITPAAGEKTMIAMLQGMVANQGDGWQWFHEQLAGFFASVSTLPAPSWFPAPSFGSERETPHEAMENAAGSLAAAALLGRRTAEMHLALATPTSDPAFTAEPMTQENLAQEARRIEAEITSALEGLKSKLSTLKDLTADQAGLLLSRRIDLLGRAHDLTSQEAAGQRIRIHGDYHLGQVLRTAPLPHPATGFEEQPAAESGDFVLLDFEGEPARPLAERRQKQSPLKDVAGMIRSFSYAAHSGLDQYLAANPDFARTSGASRLAAWATLWENSASAQFLREYRSIMAADPALLPQPEQAQSVLGAYLLEKALYELLYELNHRPAWLRIPLAGILAL
jgi:maltose alpha-D-glucosyltransferase/alpha-amylase